uniref:Uncharacterized protein n=1 Tax=Naja naja TaxID=35670 RepID=A0A8C6VGH8_NAJNA
MKAFFILIFYSFILATCQEKCYGNIPLPEFKDGKEVRPDTCVDIHDQREHLIGSTWSDDNGYRCVCTKLGSNCCKRWGKILSNSDILIFTCAFSWIPIHG